MRAPRSIRWRLQLWYGLLLVSVLTGFGFTAYQLISTRLFRRIDDELRRRLPLLVEAQRPVPGTEPQLRLFDIPRQTAALFDGTGDAACYYVVWLRHGEKSEYHSPSAPADVPMPKPGDPPFRQRAAWREVFLFPGPGDCVLVGRSVAADTASLRQFALGLTIAGVAVSLLSLAIGAWLIVRALRPIREIGATATRIAEGDLTQRIETADADTELGQLATVLNDTFARLDAAFKQQACFTSDAAHELRTPVTAVLLHAQNGLDSECPNPEHREAFEAIRRVAQRMRDLIETMLELARFDAGQECLHLRPFDLSSMAEDCVELVRPLAEARNITIRTELAPIVYNGDEIRLSQVITNMLTNAVLHNKPGGEAVARMIREGESILLSVSDNGPGISSEDAPRIFDRFYRADSSRSIRTGGAGLGLSLAREIARAHGGDLVLTRADGDRTTFVLQLPIRPDVNPAHLPSGC